MSTDGSSRVKGRHACVREPRSKNPVALTANDMVAMRMIVRLERMAVERVLRVVMVQHEIKAAVRGPQRDVM